MTNVSSAEILMAVICIFADPELPRIPVGSTPEIHRIVLRSLLGQHLLIQTLEFVALSVFNSKVVVVLETNLLAVLVLAVVVVVVFVVVPTIIQHSNCIYRCDRVCFVSIDGQGRTWPFL